MTNKLIAGKFLVEVKTLIPSLTLNVVGRNQVRWEIVLHNVITTQS